ncbi:L,D-transpeptidase catalytic domain [Massilia sp. PDC64]|nr:L,D-transpeptidase catalytic domain [Massilia sp. PDC64]
MVHWNIKQPKSATASTGGGHTAERAELSVISISKLVDLASPMLAQTCTCGKTIPKLTADGNALHQYHGAVPLTVIRTFRGRVTEWFGSHGCVRLCEDDARALFEWAPLGTVVEMF